MPNIEKDIIDGILSGSGLSASTFGLRFDRVVVRVFGALRSYAESTLPAGEAVLVAVAAPIRSPANTVDDLKRVIAALPSVGTANADHGLMSNGNSLRLKRVALSSGRSQKLIGFVHNPVTNPEPLLRLAECWLRAGTP